MARKQLSDAEIQNTMAESESEDASEIEDELFCSEDNEESANGNQSNILYIGKDGYTIHNAPQ